MKYAIYDLTTGQVLRIVTCPQSELAVQLVPAGQVYAIEVAEDQAFSDATHYVSVAHQTLQAFPAQPTPTSEWDWTKHIWVSRALDSVKAAKLLEINDWRIAAASAGFMFEGHLVSSDLGSLSTIDGVNSFTVVTGSLPPGWPGYWKAADNFQIPILTLSDWMKFFSSRVNHATLVFSTSEALKAQVAAAVSVDQVQAIVWPSTP